MRNLLTILTTDIDPTSTQLKDHEYNLREAARAVLIDQNGEIYLMHVSKFGYHKLPGGGIDPGETKEVALARELIEEVGCEATIEDEVGQIIEYRAQYNNQKQISYCYIARQVGLQRESHLEQDELDEGMVQIKASSMSAAIDLLEQDQPTNIEGRFIQKRDLAFLREAEYAAKINYRLTKKPWFKNISGPRMVLIPLTWQGYVTYIAFTLSVATYIVSAFKSANSVLSWSAAGVAIIAILIMVASGGLETPSINHTKQKWWRNLIAVLIGVAAIIFITWAGYRAYTNG